MVKVYFLVAFTVIGVCKADMEMRIYNDSACTLPKLEQVILLHSNNTSLGSCVAGTNSFNPGSPTVMAVDAKSVSCDSTTFVISMFGAATNCSGSALGSLSMDSSGFSDFWNGQCATVTALGGTEYHKVTFSGSHTKPVCFASAGTAATTSGASALNGQSLAMSMAFPFLVVIGTVTV
jgi:hypothetical protein